MMKKLTRNTGVTTIIVLATISLVYLILPLVDKTVSARQAMITIVINIIIIFTVLIIMSLFKKK